MSLLMHALVEEVLSFEPQDSEYDGASVDGRERVADGDQDDITDAVGPRGIVASEGDDRSKGKSVGVKDLLFKNILSFKDLYEET